MIGKRRSHNQKPRRGFTIVELMVSLAIISVLMSLMAPALGMARETGRRTVCLSNLRTLGQAIHMYRDEHEGALPYADHLYLLPLGWTDPIDALMPYLDVDSPHFDDEGQIATGQPYRCPSDPGYADMYGLSYGYLPSQFMGVTSDDPDMQLASAKDVTVHSFDRGRRLLPLFRDMDDWHPGSPSRGDQAPIDRNSLRFDGSVGWSADDRWD